MEESCLLASPVPHSLLNLFSHSPSAICPSVVPPIMCWALPYQSQIRKVSYSDGGIFSMEGFSQILSFQIIPVCQIVKNQHAHFASTVFRSKERDAERCRKIRFHTLSNIIYNHSKDILQREILLFLFH